MTRYTRQITSASPSQPGIPTQRTISDDNRYHLNVGGIPFSSDVFLFEKPQPFNRSKIVERHVHACGSSAFGDDGRRLPSVQAQFLKGTGSKTPIFVRFSTVTYGREFPDEARDPREFVIKFYACEGNLLCH